MTCTHPRRAGGGARILQALVPALLPPLVQHPPCLLKIGGCVWQGLGWFVGPDWAKVSPQSMVLWGGDPGSHCLWYKPPRRELSSRPGADAALLPLGNTHGSSGRQEPPPTPSPHAHAHAHAQAYMLTLRSHSCFHAHAHAHAYMIMLTRTVTPTLTLTLMHTLVCFHAFMPRFPHLELLLLPGVLVTEAGPQRCPLAQAASMPPAGHQRAPLLPVHVQHGKRC